MANEHESTADSMDAPAPPPLQSPTATDPRALAKRLAAEARARLEQQSSVPTDATPRPEAKPEMHTDKRALAQQLAAKARAKLHAAPAPTPAPEPEQTTTAPTQRRSLREVAPPTKVRMSAQEALRAALAREAQAEAEATPVASSEPTPKVSPEPPHEVAAPVAAVATEPENTSNDPAAVVLALVPNAYVKRSITVSNGKLFETLWRAHKTRALNESDYATVGTASVLLAADDTVREGALCAVHFEVDGTDYAAFVDASKRALLGILSPASPYLAGL